MKLFSKSGLYGLVLAGTVAFTAPAGATVIVGGKFALTVDGSAELASPDDERLVQQSAVLEVLD